jgi:hypothetical protein
MPCWYTAGWLDEVLTQTVGQFEAACGRWRGLYRAARRQQALQNQIITDASRSEDERRRARQLRAEAFARR